MQISYFIADSQLQYCLHLALTVTMMYWSSPLTYIYLEAFKKIKLFAGKAAKYIQLSTRQFITLVSDVQKFSNPNRYYRHKESLQLCMEQFKLLSNKKSIISAFVLYNSASLFLNVTSFFVEIQGILHTFLKFTKVIYKHNIFSTNFENELSSGGKSFSRKPRTSNFISWIATAGTVYKVRALSKWRRQHPEIRRSRQRTL